MLRCTKARRLGLTPPVTWVVAAALALVACGPARLPHLGAGPFTPGRVELLDRAVAVSAEHGYHPTDVDRTHGTFVVTARTARRNDVQFTVRCLRDGWISVEPSGIGVEEDGSTLVLPRRLRDEYLRYVAYLQDEIGHLR